MRQTLFYVPHELWGVPVFGWGWMLLVWGAVAAMALGVFWWRRGWNEELSGSLPVAVVIAAVIVFVLPHLEASTPEGVKLGLPIRGYGMMVLLGVLTGLALTLHLARHVGLDTDTVYSLAFWMFVAGIVGARAFYVIQYWPSFHHDTFRQTLLEIVKFTEGGLVVYGALLGGLLAFLVFTRRRRLPSLLVADVIVPGMALGLAFGRIGCLLNGCCFGGEVHSHAPAIHFPRYTSEAQRTLSPPYWHQLSSGRFHGIRISGDEGQLQVSEVEAGSAAEAAGVRAGTSVSAVNGRPTRNLAEVRGQFQQQSPEVSLTAADGRRFVWSVGQLPPRSLAVHPAQLYASLNAALLCLFLWALFPCRLRDGVVFASAMTIYPATRFLLEMIRDDEPGRLGTPFTISQLLSLAGLGLVAALWAYLLSRPAMEPHCLQDESAASRTAC
jgi:phosphatidylglycerol---prolipoprotein diacylglyceryl transferase